MDGVGCPRNRNILTSRTGQQMAAKLCRIPVYTGRQLDMTGSPRAIREAMTAMVRNRGTLSIKRTLCFKPAKLFRRLSDFLNRPSRHSQARAHIIERMFAPDSIIATSNGA